MSQYDLLIKKLDGFIRKFYANQLLRGGIIVLGCLLIYILLATVGEYFFYFTAQVKWALLGFFVTIGLIAFIVWVVFPFLKMQRLGNVISHERAAKIIGDFFPQVKDKLLNILQLKNQNQSSSASNELITASIDQRAAQISVVPFSNAVDLSKNKKFLPLLLLPIAVAALIFLFTPKVFTEAGYRLSQPSVSFVRPAPFSFHLLSKNLVVSQNESLTIQAELKGQKIPERLFVSTGGDQVEMNSLGENRFSYTFNRVNKPLTFRLTAADFYSDAHTIRVIQKPELQSMKLTLIYPGYTGKKTETFQGLTDVSVPAGTVLQWDLKANYTDQIAINAGAAALNFSKAGDQFKAALRFMNSLPYFLYLKNNRRTDTFRYNVQVIEDQFPQISINESKDTVIGQQVLLTGTAGDDYGISRTVFSYQILNGDNKVVQSRSVPLKSGGQVVNFSHYFDIGAFRLAPGYQVNYFVQTWDNDAINGNKSAKSKTYSFKAPNLQQLDKAMTENAEKMSAGLKSSAAQSQSRQQELKDLQKELLDNNESSWERQQKMQSMLDKNLGLKANLEQLKKRFEEQQKQSEPKNYSEELKEKQEAIKDQIDNLKDKQLAEQIKKLQELMEKQNQQSGMEELKQMEQNNKLFDMDLERLQELMKKLELQMNMEDLAKKIDALAKKQEDIQKANEAGAQSNEALDKQQEELKKALDQMMQNDMKALQKENESMDQQMPLDKAEEQGEEASEQMQNSSKQLKQNNKSGANNAQQNAKNKLQQMSKSLMEMASDMEMEQLDIDIKATRQLLTNLIRFSFDQEQLMKNVSRAYPNSPSFLYHIKEQNRLKNTTKMIKDSLFTLSKRIFKIAATVNKETSDLDQNIAKTISAMEQKNIGETVTRQQYAMTASNNLALLLNELLSNLMQSQMQAQGSGSGQPKKGKGQGSGGQMMKDIISGQQQVGQGMQQMKGGQQQGGQQQNGQQGSEGKTNGGSEGNAEQIARLAQQQALLRKQLQELQNMLNSKGIGGSVAKMIRDIQNAMDKQETDLVFRRSVDDLIQRNKEIMTRMLEAEKAIQQQEEDEKRSAESGRDAPRPMPGELSEYLKKQQELFEMYRTTPPVLKPFYQKLSEEYLKKVQPR